MLNFLKHFCCYCYCVDAAVVVLYCVDAVVVLMMCCVDAVVLLC